MNNEPDGLQRDLEAYSEPLRIDLLASSLRANSVDINVFLEVLASKLRDALPTQVQVQRHSSLFSREHPVREVAVSLGDYVYKITRERNGPPLALRSKVVRGITLKSDQVPFEHWIEELAEALGQSAAQSEQTRLALERFLL